MGEIVMPAPARLARRALHHHRLARNGGTATERFKNATLAGGETIVLAVVGAWNRVFHR